MNRVRWILQPSIFVTLLVLVFVLSVFVSREIKATKILSTLEPTLEMTANSKHTIIIEAGIELEIFHMEKFQKYGKMLKVDGNTVYLRAVSTENLEWFARQPWVKTISPWNRG